MKILTSVSVFYRKSWVDAIESVKRKLEDGETVEADEANDPSNPFSKRGEKKSRRGKSKVVSIDINFQNENENLLQRKTFLDGIDYQNISILFGICDKSSELGYLCAILF